MSGSNLGNTTSVGWKEVGHPQVVKCFFGKSIPQERHRQNDSKLIDWGNYPKTRRTNVPSSSYWCLILCILPQSVHVELKGQSFHPNFLLPCPVFCGDQCWSTTHLGHGLVHVTLVPARLRLKPWKISGGNPPGDRRPKWSTDDITRVILAAISSRTEVWCFLKS